LCIRRPSKLHTGTVRAGDYNFVSRKGNENHQLWAVLFVHHRIVLAIKGEDFVSGRASCIVLRVRWRNIVILNVHAPSEEKSDESKYSLYEELEQVYF